MVKSSKFEKGSLVSQFFLRICLPIMLFLAIFSGACENNDSPLKFDNELTRNPPDAPNIFNVVPIWVGPPNRALGVCIEGGFDNIDGFIIQRKQKELQYTTIADINQNSSNIEITNYDVMYIDQSNIGVSQSYKYRAKAYNQDGSSDWSNERTGTDPGPISADIGTYVIADAYVENTDPNTNFGDNNLLTVAGAEGYWGGIQNVLLLFSLPSVPSYGVFQSAELQLIEAGGGNTTYPGAVSIYAAPILNNWDENSVTWNNRPGSYLSTVGYGSHNPNNNSIIYIDVSEVVAEWYSGVRSNRGFMLFSGSNAYCSYYAKEGYSPGSAYLIVTYVW